MSTIPSWIDGDYTTPFAVSNPVLSQPFNGDPGEYVLTQDFWQFLANFTPLALNTAYPTLPYSSSYFLVAESPTTDLSGGICKWTRTYAAVPATRNDYSSLAYNFIGYYGAVDIAGIGSGTAPAVGRPRKTYSVTCRIQNDYFLVGPGQTYTAPSQIPVILATKYYWPQGREVVVGGVPTWVPTYPPGSTLDYQSGADADFIWDPAVWGSVIPSIPSRATYVGWITSGTEIVAEASQLSRWKGNIYQRQTKYILPQ